ncbi:bifunctional salicylyl-CoA 5-hydroxylase/oxidoreductase [Petropleomorpha daqingensis]|uniref:Anthraniloyl-CoA monooxygenase n=1 Tax=Petropleomorpha daqingensis TaxID=2026353 RepID=A0A853CL01_9ACTN|nr:bifunctional salicylyl-CoA 5-hydroxylase/oxidoreductase [Petropleomorpha daqingensis]NYJ08247.1 anthraniloyl-CoA monooxygenase [Petropleomorpha daqingensis]
MRIAVIGGGPGGLYFSALAKALRPDSEIRVWERNAPDDTFGFGVVFSDETLGGIEHADPVIHARMAERFARWDDVDVHFRGTLTTVGGQGFAAMSRKDLLRILQERCLELGVRVDFRTEAPDVDALARSHDLVIAADGANSAVRTKHADVFGPTVDLRRNKYMWLGTDRAFEAFEFVILETPHGVMQVHGYPYDAGHSTVIIEMHDDVWRRAGFAASAGRAFPPGVSDEESIARVAELLGGVLEGHGLLANNSKWTSFPTVTNRTWRHGNVVLLGDAAHTAHFSIGSGTKLAMEDALALVACLHEQPGVPAALEAYEAERRPVVLSTQRAAQASLEWFENIGQYVGQDPEQFAFNIVTRSRRITYDNLRLRDPEFVARMDEWFAGGADVRPPMFRPFRLGGLELVNRVVVSPMDMYSAVDGLPTDFHLVHLGARALGGAGLVMTEMVCVSPSGRITPGCAGIYTPEQEAAWARVAAFVHANSAAKVGLQIGHSGRKGSTKLMWEGIDEPLPDGNWDVVGPSPVPYSPANQVPRELSTAELAAITAEFVACAQAGGRAGFDVLELHCAHGYLLSSFLSPLSNHRTDEYGGDLARRLRYPLEVFDAVRAVWAGPMSVRISATDWCEGGTDVEDAVAIARSFAEHGADAIHVSTGQVVKEEAPAYGRSYQTPYADRIRQEVGLPLGVAVIAVGAISSYDDVNSILLAGRADLVAVGRPHLYDPHWTLHAAADQGYEGPGVTWPAPYRAGSRTPPTGRTDGPPPRLTLIRQPATGTRHARWISPSRP